MSLFEKIKGYFNKAMSSLVAGTSVVLDQTVSAALPPEKSSNWLTRFFFTHRQTQYKYPEKAERSHHVVDELQVKAVDKRKRKRLKLAVDSDSSAYWQTIDSTYNAMVGNYAKS